MCTAYEIGKKSEHLPARLKNAAAEALRSLAQVRIVRPTLAAPVIMPDGELREMSWGFRRKFRGAKGAVSRTIVNSREDKLDSPMWREAFRQRRCLISAIAFYEWVEGTRRQVGPAAVHAAGQRLAHDRRDLGGRRKRPVLLDAHHRAVGFRPQGA